MRLRMSRSKSGRPMNYAGLIDPQMHAVGPCLYPGVRDHLILAGWDWLAMGASEIRLVSGRQLLRLGSTLPAQASNIFWLTPARCRTIQRQPPAHRSAAASQPLSRDRCSQPRRHRSSELRNSTVTWRTRQVCARRVRRPRPSPPSDGSALNQPPDASTGRLTAPAHADSTHAQLGFPLGGSPSACGLTCLNPVEGSKSYSRMRATQD